MDHLNICRAHADIPRRIGYHPGSAPDLVTGRRTGTLRSCEWCGSMHPADVAAAIRAGARGELADAKYGWPHKAYFDGIPNPNAGLTEIRSSCNFEKAGYERLAHPRYDTKTGERIDDYVEWVEKSTAPATTYGKFYTVHLLDASHADRETIEQHLGVRFEFSDDGRVQWCRHPGKEVTA
jgi:hypothetical protein